MDKKNERMQNVITVGEVCSILKKHDNKYDVAVLRELLMASRKERTVKNWLLKCGRYIKAFFTALFMPARRVVKYEGKFSKGAVKHGREDV